MQRATTVAATRDLRRLAHFEFRTEMPVGVAVQPLSTRPLPAGAGPGAGRRKEAGILSLWVTPRMIRIERLRSDSGVGIRVASRRS